MSLLMVLSALHVDKEIFQCKRESCGLPSLSQKKVSLSFSYDNYHSARRR